MVDARPRARIRLAAELAGWDLQRDGLTDIYCRGGRRIIVIFDLHDGVVAGYRRSRSRPGPAEHIGWRDDARIIRSFTRPRWTTTD